MEYLASVDRNPNLLSSFLVCIFTIFIIITSSINIVTHARLNDGTITGLGRYTITFEAYELIENDMTPSVVFLGSSKMREAIDGHLIEELSNETYSVYNIGYAGERPYHRMVEIDSLLQSKPDVVILELGPNSFSSLSTPLTGANLDKMKLLMSLSKQSPIQSTYYTLISDEDKEILPINNLDKVTYLNRFTPKAYEKSMEYMFGLDTPLYECGIDVQCAPSTTSDEFDNYLRYPPQFPDWLASYREQDTEEQYFDRHLDNFYNSSLHSSEGVYNNNHMAYDFIIQSLIDEGITVILIALPYHPRSQNQAPNGHWDYVNQSIIEYNQNPDVIMIDWFWENWGNQSFIDISHFSRTGEIEAANRINLILKENF